MTPLIISDESIRQFRALIDRTPNVPAGHGIRIYISGLGSGGPEWSLTTDAFDPALDECCEFDGLKIIVDRELLEAVGGLDVQFENVDEDGAFLITPLAPSYLHGWSPDGKTLAYCAERGGEYDIYTIPVLGGKEKRMTDAPGLNDGSEYDSAGEYIWFNSVRSGLMQAFRMKADGSEQTQMTFDSEWNTWFPHISPDRKLVSMICYRKGDVEPGEHVPHKNVQIRVMRSDGSDLHTVVELFGGQGTINVNSWSPDSRKFAFVSYRIRPHS